MTAPVYAFLAAVMLTLCGTFLAWWLGVVVVSMARHVPWLQRVPMGADDRHKAGHVGALPNSPSSASEVGTAATGSGDAAVCVSDGGCVGCKGTTPVVGAGGVMASASAAVDGGDNECRSGDVGGPDMLFTVNPLRAKRRNGSVVAACESVASTSKRRNVTATAQLSP